MIPITVSYFVKRSELGHRTHIKEALIYMAGIIAAFSLIGLVTSVFFGASQMNEIAANPWVNLFIAAVFIGLALNLFGVFEVRISNRFINRFQSRDGSGVLSVLSMAVVFTLTTFTCTMPFMGTILVIASQNHIFYPLIGMFCYGFSFSLPFFFLALFPKLMQDLPRSGDWMYTTKIAMGFLELAAALKFLSNADMVWQFTLLTRNTFLVIWAFIFALLGLYFLKIIRFPLESKTKVSLPRLGLGLASFLVAVNLFYAKDGRTFSELEAFLPPPEYGNESYTSNLNWMDDLSQARELARQQDRQLFIDFTGYTCINCRWMEQNLFTRKPSENLLSRFVLVRLYTDGDGQKYEENQRYQRERFNTVALPFYAIITPEERVISTFEGMTRDAEVFNQFLLSGMK